MLYYCLIILKYSFCFFHQIPYGLICFSLSIIELFLSIFFKIAFIYLCVNCINAIKTFNDIYRSIILTATWL